MTERERPMREYLSGDDQRKQNALEETLSEVFNGVFWARSDDANVAEALIAVAHSINRLNRSVREASDLPKEDDEDLWP